MNFFADYLGSLALLYVINALLVIVVIFTERKEPAATLAWIMVLTFIPIAGIVFYLVFNQNFSRSKINRLTEKEEFAVNSSLNRQMESMDKGDYDFSGNVAEKWKHLIKLNQVYGRAYYTQDNDVELYTDGNLMFEAVLQDIKNAETSINAEYYILKRDHVGRRFIQALTEKAKEGVEVRLLLDAMGSRYITKSVLKEFIAAGGKVGYFFKPKFAIFGIKLNYRNHRKILIIDDKVAYTGGYNIAREYLGQKKKFGYWRDTHIRIRGGAVYDLNARFILDWRFTTRENLPAVKPQMENAEAGAKGIQIVSCGPESPKEEVKRAFMRMITYAQKNVYVQTPYFVPDPSIIESLKMAAQSGIDVRVMIPCMPDHMFVYWATYSYVGELLRSGARVFIYDEGFLHAKTLVVDGEVGTVGSTNFDNRSFRLNFETNAFIFDDGFALKMEETFRRDMEKGHELTLEDYMNRSLIIKFKEAISRLLADIL
ncbi:MAG: cardiolipin synthase [Candidatus Fimisoma sp.]